MLLPCSLPFGRTVPTLYIILFTFLRVKGWVLILTYEKLNPVVMYWFCMIEQNKRQRDVFIIEAEVTTPQGRLPIVQTSKVSCSGDVLPSLAGTFTFLLPADIPGTFHINFKFKSLGQIGNCGVDEVLVDEIKTFVVTHYQNKNLSDYCDGHFVPAVEVPVAKKQLVGKCFHKKYILYC